MKKDRAIASKTSLNLAIREKTWVKSAWIVPVLAVILVVAALVGKFGVADRLAQVAAAQREVAAIKSDTEAMQAAYADYDEVEKQYNLYTYKDFDRTLADRVEVLALIEREIMGYRPDAAEGEETPTPAADDETAETGVQRYAVQRLSLANKQLNLSLLGPKLRGNSELINRLKADPLVSEVRVTSSIAARAGDEMSYTSEMTIILADAVEEGEVDE